MSNSNIKDDKPMRNDKQGAQDRQQSAGQHTGPGGAQQGASNVNRGGQQGGRHETDSPGKNRDNPASQANDANRKGGKV
jgi:hypothetical protein